MELDDLKQTWKQPINQKPVNKHIMEMIQHKSYGPVAALKKMYRKQMVVMAIMPIVLILTNVTNIESTLSSIMYWTYVALCIAVIVFAAFNYREAEKMQHMDGMVKQQLESRVALLEKRLHWNLIGLRFILLFFILLAETVPYFQHYRMLDKWHDLPVWIRIGIYALFLGLQYFVGPIVMHRKFGQHIAYLKKLVSEM